jgi:hypothetical protein
MNEDLTNFHQFRNVPRYFEELLGFHSVGSKSDLEGHFVNVFAHENWSLISKGWGRSGKWRKEKNGCDALVMMNDLKH